MTTTPTIATNRRDSAGVKYSSDQYRAGGDRIIWIDGFVDEITLRVVAEIRAAGFKAWRTKDQVWILNSDAAAIAALKISTDRVSA